MAFLKRLFRRLKPESLSTRMAVILSLGVLPLGLLSLEQTLRLVRSKASAVSDEVLIGRSTGFDTAQRALLMGARDFSEEVSPDVWAAIQRNATCAEIETMVEARSSVFEFAGFLMTDGRLYCLPAGGVEELFEINPTTRSRVVLREGFYEDGAFRGVLMVRLPSDLLASPGTSAALSPAVTVLADAMGNIVSVNPSDTDPSMWQTASSGAALPAPTEAIVSTGTNLAGASATFVSAPLIANRLYITSVWGPEVESLKRAATGREFAPPLLMWLAALAISGLAIQRLVVRHLQTLNSGMRRFALGARTQMSPVSPSAPSEIQELSNTFVRLSKIITREEADLEAALAQQSALVREVHHRVKNNLQLIVSIIRMQMRRTRNPEIKDVLRGMQDRVLSIASIYRTLYETDHVSAVRADRLLRAVALDQARTDPARATAKLDIDASEIVLDADQVVPLSLLASEVLQNAFKNLPETGAKAVRLRFFAPEVGKVVLEVENTTPSLASDPVPQGLGAELIAAFAAQLEAEVQEGRVADADGTPLHRVRVSFATAGTQPGHHA